MSAPFANRRLFAALCLSAGAAMTACGGGEPKPTPAPAPASAAPTAPPSAASVAAEPDPAPTVTQITGTLEPVALPAASLSVITAETQGGHVYLWAKDPKSIAPGSAGPVSIFEGGIERLTCRVPGKRHAVAVPVPEEAGVRVRLVGAEAAPDPLEVVCQRGAELPLPDGETDPSGAGATQTFRLTGASRTDHKPARAAFFQAMASWLEARARINWSRSDPTLAYAAARAGKLADPKLPRPNAATGPAARGDLGEMMSLYTGVTSAEEALQTDRGLRVRPDVKAVAKARTVALSAVEGVPLPSHPWAAMIAEKKLTPKVEALASLAPADALYLHFGDIRTFVTLLRDVDRFLAPAARALEMSPGEWGLAERYEGQLAVERTGLAEKLGHLAVRSIGVVVGDPLLREGTDVALLFDLENETLLNGVLSTFAANAKTRHPDAVESTVTIAGRAVSVLASPDGAVRQHKVKVGNALVLANSPAAIARILATADAKHPALAGSGDYQYFRGLYPAEEKRGFVFLSDAFVGRMTSPAFKIAAARRMEAAADLRAVSGAALLHAMLEGTPAPDAAALVKAGVLAADELVHADGAAITFDAVKGPKSAWGAPGRLVPLSESVADVTRVSPAEREAYDRFRESYQQYWRTFIDPIGVEIAPRADGAGWAADARLLPLIDGTEYRDLIRLTGGGSFAVPETRDGLLWRVALGPDSEVRRDLERDGRNLPGLQSLSLSWLGEWAGIGMLDRSAVWEAALMDSDVHGLRRHPHGPQTLQALARLPLFAEIQIRDRLAFAAFLTGIRAAVDQTAAGLVRWDDGGMHRDVPIVTLSERPQGGMGMLTGGGMSLHYAIAGDAFILSLNKTALKARIDAAFDAVATPSPVRTQVALQYSPTRPDGWMNRTIAGVTEAQSASAHRAASRAAELFVWAFPGLTPAERDARSTAWLGFTPVSPYGGGFTTDARGDVAHDRVGSELRPTVPESPMVGAPLSEFLSHLVGLRCALAFEGEGNHRGMHVGLGWQTK
jgi:hypothetical protein